MEESWYREVSPVTVDEDPVGTHQPRETRESRTTAEQNTVGRCWLLVLVGLLSVESGPEACVLHPGVQAQV